MFASGVPCPLLPCLQGRRRGALWHLRGGPPCPTLRFQSLFFSQGSKPKPNSGRALGKEEGVYLKNQTQFERGTNFSRLFPTPCLQGGGKGRGKLRSKPSGYSRGVGMKPEHLTRPSIGRGGREGGSGNPASVGFLSSSFSFFSGGLKAFPPPIAQFIEQIGGGKSVMSKTLVFIFKF